MADHASNALKDIFIGFIVGVTSMLPGISGATICVVFNIYERLVRDLADLRTYLKKDIKFILLLAIGAVIGIILCAKILEGMIDEYPVEAMLFFVGLIVGQLIPLFKEVRSEGKNKIDSKTIIVFAIGFAIMMIMVAFELIDEGKDIEVNHDFIGIILMILVGAIVAVSSLLPGMSHSTILLVCGLMEAFIAVFSDLDFILMIPLIIGVIAAALGFSKIINRALEEHHYLTKIFILALTLGSVIVIAVTAMEKSGDCLDWIAGIILMMIGFGITLGSMKMGNRVSA